MLVAVVPAAGHALRLGPQSASKEVLPVAGRPVMDHLVERLQQAGPDELRVVTRPEKADVTAHARALGAEVVHGHPADVAASLRLGLTGLADDDEVLFGFPDTVFEPLDSFVQVLAALRVGADAALGLFRVPPTDLTRSDVVVLGDDGRVARIEVKPAVPPSDLIWGLAATRVGVLRAVPNGTEPGAHFDRLARSGTVLGVPLSDQWLDIGVPAALARALTGRPPEP